MVIMPLGPQLMRLFSIDAQQFSFLVSSYTFSAGIMGFFAAFFIDRFDRKHALILGYIGFLIGTLCCGLANSYELLMAARIFTGLFGGILNALVLAIIGDRFQLKKRASAMGIVMAAFSAAAVLGVPMGLYIAAELSWNYTFLILAGVGTLMLIGLFGLIPSMREHLETVRKQETPLEVVQRIARNGNQVRALSFKMCLILSQFMIIPFVAPFMVGNIGFSEIELTYIYLLGGALTLVTGPVIGRIADARGHKKIFIYIGFLSIIAILGITHMPPMGIPLALLGTSLFFILISGRAIPSTTMVVSSAASQHRAGFMSFSSAFQQLSAGLAAIIAGAILVETPDKQLQNFEYIGYLCVALTLIAIFIGSKVDPVEETQAEIKESEPVLEKEA